MSDVNNRGPYRVMTPSNQVQPGVLSTQNSYGSSQQVKNKNNIYAT